MGYYDKEDTVTQYIEMAEGYDGRELIERLEDHLPVGSSVLEIGMGPGVDLDILSKTYRTTGSDKSQYLLDRYRKAHPDAELLLLDAETLETDRRFDAVYSNKVLHHISYAQMRTSFSHQAEILNPGGIIMHSFWYGDSTEEYSGMLFNQVTEQYLKDLIGPRFEIIELIRYTEMEDADSLYVIARCRDNP